jgi:hypothetical protein
MSDLYHTFSSILLADYLSVSVNWYLCRGISGASVSAVSLPRCLPCGHDLLISFRSPSALTALQAMSLYQMAV